MAELPASFRRFLNKLLPYLTVARLWPLDLPLLPLIPMLTALTFAGGGHLAWWGALGALLGTPLAWAMAWSYFDFQESSRSDKADSLMAKGLLTRKQLLSMGAVLASLALLDALLLGGKSVMLALGVLVLVIGYPWIRRRSYLADGWFAVAVAMVVPFAYASQGAWPDQLAMLLSLSTLFWVIGWSVLRGWPQQQAQAARGVYSLGLMFGPLTGWVVSGLQLMALLGWWMVGQHANSGGGYQAGLFVALGLIVLQGRVMRQKGAEGSAMALALHLVVGAVIWLVALGPLLA